MWTDLPLFPEAASRVAGEVDALYLFLIAVSTFFVVVIFGLVFFFAVKYRRRSEDERPRPIVGSLHLELMWTIIPLILALAMFAWGAKLYFDLYTPPQDAINVYVVAKQWMWKAQHPQGNREINELHVPVGQPVRLIMTSEDVIHSFFVPAFRVKMDVLPGRYTTMWFEATKPGKYHLFCAEYCGTNHSLMGGWVYAMEPTEFQEWVAAGRPAAASMSSGGAELFAKLGCRTCHSSDSESRGPDLAGLWGKTVHLSGGGTVQADEAYIRESLVDPTAKIVSGYQPLMPTYQGQVTEEEILELIAYVRSLPGGAAATDLSRPGTAASPAAERERIEPEP